ncbi:MAG: hypothetical protein ABEJ23_06135 [Haloarculaceae archaeon]
MDATDRFLAYAAGQALVLGALVGLAAAVVPVSPLGVSHQSLAAASGAGARLAHLLVQWLAVAVPVLYVLVPLAVVGWLAATDRTVPQPAVAALALLLVFLTGAAGGTALAGPAGALVETQRTGAPQVAFAFDYAGHGDGRGVVTVTHDGGAAVRVDRLSVEGTGIADVPGATQTAAGRWQGAASGRRAGEAAVVRGDSVAVGVERGCAVRIVYRTEWSATVVARRTCPEL